jgi:hypothetical protein
MTDLPTPTVSAQPAAAPAVRPTYEAPRVTSYTDAALLEALGPAHARAYTFPNPNS